MLDTSLSSEQEDEVVVEDCSICKLTLSVCLKALSYCSYADSMSDNAALARVE